MLLKILLLGVIIFGIYYFFIKQKPTITNSKKEADKKEADDILVECQKCGTFVSTKEAIIKDGKYYCSKECAK